MASNLPSRWFLRIDKRATLSRIDVEPEEGMVVSFTGVGIVRAVHDREKFREVRLAPLELNVSDRAPNDQDAPVELALVR